MIDPVILINMIFAVMAVISGLSSRNFSTALVAGLVMGLIHAGLIALVVAQSGSTAIAELPYLRDGVDLAITSGYITFMHGRVVAYLVEIALATLITTVIAYLVRWIVVSIIGFATPKRAAT